MAPTACLHEPNIFSSFLSHLKSIYIYIYIYSSIYGSVEIIASPSWPETMVTLLSRTIGKDEQLEVFHYQPLPNVKSTPCPSVVEEEDEDGTLWRRFDEVGGTEEKREMLVCVTSGTSYLGSAIVHRLLSRGYSVRIAVSNQGTSSSSSFNSPFSWRRRRLVGVVEGGVVLCFL